MSNENLIPFSERSEEEVREMNSRGGINSGVARRKKRDRLQALKDYIDEGVSDDLTRYDVILRKVVTALKDKPSVADFQRLLELTGDFIPRQKVDVNAEVSAVVDFEDAMRNLYMPFGEVYQRFFYETKNERHVIMQGGRRSGKTQATFRHLLRLGAAMRDGAEVLVCTSAYPMLEQTIKDFKTATGGRAEVHAQQAETEGMLWTFKSFDEYHKAQGSQCDFLFINEAVNMREDIADTLVLGCRRQVFYNYNPTEEGWVTKNVNEKNLLKTTFQDNPYLPAMQVEEFEKMKERALQPNASAHDTYMYEVYYLGNFAKIAGAVFGNITTCSLRDYQQVQARECFGLDFGFATDGDPTALVGVKIFNNKIYAMQYIYMRGLTSDAELISRMLELGLTERTEVSADYGGNGRQRIINCRGGAGVVTAMNIINAIKPKIIDNLGRMLTFDEVVVVETSADLLRELKHYEIANSKPKGDDHAIDALRYAFNYADRL